MFTWHVHIWHVCLCHNHKVGQVHGGLMGVIQRAMVRSCPHIWFERAEMKDRHLVTQRYYGHKFVWYTTKVSVSNVSSSCSLHQI